MSQKAVEGLLGRLVTDREFRDRFYGEPTMVCAEDSIEITGRELQAILKVDEAHVEEFATRLDATLVRATLGESRHLSSDRHTPSNGSRRIKTK